MNKVFILRHAKAGVHTTDDHDRPLTEVGRQQAEILGQWFRDHEIYFDHVLTSSSLRTVETVESLGLSTGFVIVPRLYSASAATIESVVRESGIDSGTILVVAHNPGVSDLVASAGHEIPMSTCTVVELECDEPLSEFTAGLCSVGATFRPEV